MAKSHLTIKVQEYFPTMTLVGSELGRHFRQILEDLTESLPTGSVVSISFMRNQYVDAVFLSRSVISLAAEKLGRLYFVFENASLDTQESMILAGRNAEVPIISWSNSEAFVYPPVESSNIATLIEGVRCYPGASTPDIARLLNTSVPNASTRLKQLSRAGYLRRVEVTHETGGSQYLYEVPGAGAIPEVSSVLNRSTKRHHTASSGLSL
ncbi:hypothetical protein ACYPKM_04845 [Pseudomonas aeruginosa]